MIPVYICTACVVVNLLIAWDAWSRPWWYAAFIGGCLGANFACLAVALLARFS